MSVKAPSLHPMTEDDLQRGSRYYDEPYPRYVEWPPFSRYFDMIKEPAGEFLGTMFLIILGVGSDCQVGLSQNPNVVSSPRGNELTINFSWAVAVGFGVFISSAAGGGHCNPALTLGLAVFRGFSWRKVPGYILAQTFGAFVGTAIVYGNYIHAVDIFEGTKGIRTLATAGFFTSYPLDYMTNISCFFSEFLTTGVIFIGLLAILDKRHGAPFIGFVPLMIVLLVLGVGTSLGMETNYSVNPARDLGSRLLTVFVGYGGQVFSFRGQYWIWAAIIAPVLGVLVGGIIYDVCLFNFETTTPPPPTSPPAIPHKLKFDTYRSERTHSVRADSHYDIEQGPISVGAV